MVLPLNNFKSWKNRVGSSTILRHGTFHDLTTQPPAPARGQGQESSGGPYRGIEGSRKGTALGQSIHLSVPAMPGRGAVI